VTLKSINPTRQISLLAQEYPVELIEAAAVQEFLAQRHLKTRNQRLLTLTSQKDERLSLIRTALCGLRPSLCLEDLSEIFELAIPTVDRDLNGAVYTPVHIADFMCQRTITRGDEVVADISCGAGAFLLAAVRRLRQLSGQTVPAIVAGQIIGRDILPYSIRHARLLLALLALELGEEVAVMPDRLSVGDSFEAAWRAEIVTGSGVDVVVGNPPYIRLQELPMNVRANLAAGHFATVAAGNFDLYFAFFEVGLDLLKAGGHLAYITPNTYFTTKTATPLRRLLAETGYLREIIDCGDLAIFNVATYSTLTFLTKMRGETFIFRRPTEQAEQFAFDQVPAATLPTAELTTAGWRLGYADEMEFLHAVESCGSPLASFAKLGVGLATLRDYLFFLGSAPLVNGTYQISRDGQAYQIEPEVTCPIVKISEHLDQASLDRCQTRMLFPYEINQTGEMSLIPEEKMQTLYSGALAYLTSIRPELAKRDHGRKKYEAWYAYGRRQGLKPLNTGQLLTTVYSATPRFLLDPAPGRRTINGYAVVPTPGSLWATETGLRTLQVILQSEIMALYITLTSTALAGGYFCYAGNYLARFGLPDLTLGQMTEVRSLSPQVCADWYATRAKISPQNLNHLRERFLKKKN
jgi:adenine-specific DNA-methyltransferase